MHSTTAKYLILLTGPTAVGKTALLDKINPKGDQAVISADSRQVYREMHIGTDRPSKEEMSRMNIKLAGHRSIHDIYTAGDFETEAITYLDNYYSEHDLAILCGGTGLYIKAVTDGLDTFPEVSPDILINLETQLDTEGLQPLAAELKQSDPEYASWADLHNPRRVVRALSIIRQTGRPFSSFLTKEKKKRQFSTVPLVLDRPRPELYDRINERVLDMMDRGLLEEAKILYPFRKLRALQTVGYQELFAYLDDHISLDEAVAEIQKNTRRYAKRQMTWFNKYIEGPRYHPDNVDEIRYYLDTQLKK